MTVIFITTTGAGTFSAPGDWPGIADKIATIGCGGNGQAGNNTPSIGTGGGGGAYSAVLSVSLANGANLNVGAPSGVAGGTGGDTWIGGTNLATSICGAKGGGGAQASGTAGVGGAAASGVGTTKFSGGNGGAYTLETNGGGTGGGGAAGPNGNGANGGAAASTSNVTGGSGGGGGGGGTAGTAGGTTTAGTAGGLGANGSGTVAGTGGAGGTSSTISGVTGSSSSSSSGGGGGGGFGNGGAAAGVAGGAGGAGTEWDASHGSGGGGGGNGSIPSGSSDPPGNGGVYGGGGGGGGNASYTGFGSGAQGIIVITYTPSAGVAAQPTPPRLPTWNDTLWPSQSAAPVAGLLTPLAPSKRPPRPPPWFDTTWMPQSASPIAAAIAPNAPPPRRLVPIIVMDPQRPIHGDGWLYGFTTQGSGISGAASAPEVDTPPFPGAAFLTAQSERVWQPETWNSQRTGFTVQPGLPVGSAPPGVWQVPEPAAWGLWDPWPAQSTRLLPLAVVAPPVVSQPPRSAFATTMALLWRETANWPYQTQPRGAAVAGTLPPPPFMPYSATSLYGLVLSWGMPQWDSQRAHLLPPSTPKSGDEPPGFTPTPDLEPFGYYAPWPSQMAGRIAGLIPPASVSPPIPRSWAPLYALLGIWTPATWVAQRGGIVASLVPPPAVNPPPMRGPRGAYEQRASGLWAPELWDTRKVVTFRGWFGPTIWQTVYDLVNAGLEPFVVWIPSVVVPYGYTISTNPPPGTTLPLWTPVTCYASSGLPTALPNVVTTPALAGLTANEAAQEIFDASLSLGAPLWQIDASDGGTVIGQSPQSGALVLPGTIVVLTLSLGPTYVPPTTVVPN